MTLSEELQWRGFIKQTTFSKISDIDEPRTFYFGVDPSAESMTIGNLASVMMVKHLTAHGHKPILLAGGATGMIGDPDGKKQERDVKSLEEVEKNTAGIIRQYQNLFAGQDLEIVNNFDWFKSMNYLDFLREVGKHMSMTQLLDRDFIQSRIGEGGSGISYAEFSYSLIQGYDFLHLFREKGATLQVAGSDQWGNSICGVSLIRKLENAEAHVITMPLIINKSTGVKFGKSEDGAIWLDAEKTSVFKFYQFCLNLDDEGVVDYLKIFTLLSKEKIEDIASQHAENTGERLAQKALATELTTLVHGQERCESVKRVSAVLFGGSDFSSLSDGDLEALATEIPTVATGKNVAETLVEAGLAKSGGEARRLVEGGAISINGEKIIEIVEITQPSLIKKGKNSFALAR